MRLSRYTSILQDPSIMLDAKIPDGGLEDKWTRYRSTAKLVSPANRKKFRIAVIGTGLAGSSLAASLGELGYAVVCFSFHDTARRAHSVAAQGGVNACKNYKNDGDTIFRMFYDTIKGGDFRAREANVYRLAECSANLIDQAVAQGVPFAREYSGYLSNRSFGGVQVSRTFYARGQTGQQLLLGAYQALMRQVEAGTVQLFTRHEFLDLVVIDGQARGVIAAFDAAACIGCGACVGLARTRARLCSQQLKSCTWLYFPRGKSRGNNVSHEWWHRWIERDSGTAAIQKHARWNAHRRSRCCTSLA